MDIYQTLQKELSDKVIKNELLSSHTTFKIGGPAKYFFIAESKEEISKAIRIAQKLNLPFFILGKGSNLLVSDKGFNGLVIKLQITNCKLQDNRIISEAGTELTELVDKTAEAGLTGLEFLSGIPGTVGAAVYGNVGAFGKSVSDILISAEILDLNNKIREVNNDWFEFNYRESKLKRTKEIVLNATFQLKSGSKKEIKKLIDQYLAIRREKHPLDYPNAGSVFKNIELKSLNKNLRTLFKDKAKEGKLAAGWLIEQCGLKGTRIGKAKISEKHANFIVNLGNAKANDVIELMELIKEKVYDKFKVRLEEETQKIGF